MFKAGDIVEITDESDATGMLDFVKGKGYTVELYAGGMVNVVNESGKLGWYSKHHFKLKEKEEKKVETLFNVGQVVWDVVYGKGIVADVDYDERNTYPVKVVYDGDGGYDFYTPDGKLEEDDKIRRLYFSEPKIEAATEPVFEPVLKKGDLIVAIDVTTTNSLSCLLTVVSEDEHFVKTEEYGVMGKERWDFYRLGEKIVFN